MSHPATLPAPHRRSAAAQVAAAAGYIVAELRRDTPAAEWPQAADRELLIVGELLHAAGVDPAHVLDSAAARWLATVGA